MTTSFSGICAPHARNYEQEAAEDDPSVIPEISQYFPSPPDATPETLFPPGIRPDRFGVPLNRFFCRTNSHILIYTDGACSENGTGDAAGGCAFYFRPPGVTLLGYDTTGVMSFRLEDTGPSGLPGLQSSNRAELRAVIAALQFRVWYGEGHEKVVIATDSEYVVLGVTVWVRKWGHNGWVNSAGKPIANRDLWDELLKELRHYQRRGTSVEFWRVPRALNTVADKAAKAAAQKPRVDQYAKITGVCL